MSETDPSPSAPAATNQPWQRILFNLIAVVLCVFVLVGVNSNLFNQQSNLALFGLLGVILVLLSQPFIKRWSNSWLLRGLDVILMIGAAVAFGYVFVQSEPLLERFWIDGIMLGNRAGNERSYEYAIGLVGLIIVLEATRRSIGWTLPILCVAFILYAMFGPYMPDWAFPHAGQSWQRIVQKTFLQSDGVFGIALRVMFLYVFLFVLFGTLLEQTGATAYIISFARNLFRNSSGGPAKVAVVSSGLMGSLSGSAVANTATTGTFTIPLMRSSGFQPASAAGVEAAASSGGALMPPIMGAGAYMMLELVEPTVTYVQIIKAAVIPALLYYFALLLAVHFHAKKIGATTEAQATAESLANPTLSLHPYQGVVFFGSFVVLIVALLQGYTPFRAVSYSLVGILILSVPSRFTRLTPSEKFPAGHRMVSWLQRQVDSGRESGQSAFALIVQFLQSLVAMILGICEAMFRAAKSGIPLIVAAGCVGIILGIVNQTGIGAQLPEKVQALAGNNELLALVTLMISTIILGMGLPSAVCYLLMAILIGSVLSQLETAPLAAHLFIFYFGMMSMVTPPVALAAYTAAAIAKADIMKSAFAAFRFALVGFALPYAFVLRPELLMLTAQNEPASVLSVVIHVSLTLIGIVGLAAGLTGFAFRRFPLPFQFLLVAVSLTIFFTRLQGWQLYAQLIAAALICVILAANLLMGRQIQKDDGAKPTIS